MYTKYESNNATRDVCTPRRQTCNTPYKELGGGEHMTEGTSTIDNVSRIADAQNDPLGSRPTGTERADIDALIKRVAQQDEEIERQLAWLKIALRQTDDIFWDYDLSSSVLRTFSYEEPFGLKEREYANFPEYGIETGLVHADSIGSIREFFQKIRNGVPEGSGRFLLNDHLSGTFVWSTLYFRTLSDENGTPLRAIGVRNNSSTRFSQIGATAERDVVPETLFPHLFAFLKADPETGGIELLAYQGIEQNGMRSARTYDECLKKGVEHLFSAEDEAALRSQFSLDRLLARYREGVRWSGGRYRFVDSDGTIHSVLVGTNVRKSLRTGKLEILSYLCELGQIVQWETKTATALAHNPITRLYTPDSARNILRVISAESSLSARCSVTMFKLVGMERLVELDRTRAQRLKRDIGLAIIVFLGTDCVVYDQDTDTLVVVIPDVGTDANAQKRAGDALAATRTSLEDALSEADVNIVAGTSCGPTQLLDLDMALSQAEMLCALHRDPSRDAVTFAPEASEEPADESTGGVVWAESESAKAKAHFDKLSARAFTRCLSAMLEADSPGASINRALESLGSFYRADRVYVLSVAAKDQMLAVLFEWMIGNRTSVQRSFTGQSVDRFPLIKRYLETNAPVLVSRPAAMPRSARSYDREPWRFAIVPIDRTNERSMMLCVENPHANLSRWGVASRTAPHILHAWTQLSAHPRHASFGAGSLGQLPDDLAFEHACQSCTSDNCSSIGVLAIDIPCAQDIVSNRGLSHAFDTVSLIARSATETFGADSLFHTGDTEFIVLCRDTTYESFIQRCARVRAQLLQACSGEFRLGSTWSSDVSSLAHLVDEARMIMVRDDGCNPFNDDEASEPASGPALLTSLGTASSVEAHFDVYLQPKIDMRTGALVGAEALARSIDDHGNATAPIGAIEQMERDGKIRDLDYFVFDRTLSLMNDWRIKGLGLVPMSSNFSRSTLLGSSALASVLAIMSRYPDVPPNMMEMEVTETACDLSKTTFAHLVDTFRETGLRVALDDFGSHYSSAAILANVNFDVIKLDRNLINDVPHNDSSRLLVKSIVEICNNRHMTCIAEGIETEAQASALVEEGCYYCQGFYYDKPMPADDFERKYLLNGASN